MITSEFKRELDLLDLSSEDLKTVNEISERFKLRHINLSNKNIIASTVYVLGILNKDAKSMRVISELFNTNITSISAYYKDIAKIWGCDLNFY